MSFTRRVCGGASGERARLGRRAAWLLLATLALASCYPSAKPPQIAYLNIKAEPDTTSVYVDDHYVGNARVLATRPVALKTGVRFLTFKAPDYFPHDLKLDLAAGTTSIEIKLRPIPP
ncbi:MAG: hypothetical protein ACHQ53_12375 [Polyangiales bacterium]